MKVSVLVKSVGIWLTGCISAADAEGKAPRKGKHPEQKREDWKARATGLPIVSHALLGAVWALLDSPE